MMDLRLGKTRTNVEVDRLSILPDDLIHKILSFNSSKGAVETSVLSSRWRFIWTSIPHLHFSTNDFPDLRKFLESVTHFLSRRNNQTEVSSVDISFREKFSFVIVKKILKYAFSHNVQQLTISCWFKKEIIFPLSLFNSQSLKHLTLTGSDFEVVLHMLESTWDLEALTTLHLDHVSFVDHDKDNTRMSVFKVVAPQLKNLIITNCLGEYFVSAPNIFTLIFSGNGFLSFSEEGPHSLEKVDLCICSLYKNDPCKIINLFQQLHSVRFLKLNTELVEFLSSHVELILHQVSPFTNLKSLKIYPNGLSEVRDVKEDMFTEVVNYLQNSSTNASFTLVSREEARAAYKTKLAQNLMAELRVQLDEEKTNIETQKAKITMVNSCWEDLRARIEQGKIKICGIVSMLQHIHELVNEIPASKREKVQACFCSLDVEANIVMNQMMDCVKIKCDEHQYSLSVGFSTTSQPSS